MKTKQIKYLDGFIDRWYKWEGGDQDKEMEAKLCDEYKKFVKENNLPFISADELRSGLINT